jgi:tellurite methyltransferase
VTAGRPEKDHPDRLRWNRRYRDNPARDSDLQPSRWLVSHRRLLVEQPKGPALDLACGRGRNSRYLARLGFEVDAVDISDVEIERLKERAARWRLPIHPRVQNLESGVLPRDRYRVIVNINYLERRIFPAIVEALLPGGLLFFVSFLQGPSAPLRGKINPAYLLDPGELPRAFSALEILDYREGNAEEPAPPGRPEAAFLAARKER